MELPTNLKQLYRHWEHHTSRKSPQELVSVIADTHIARDIEQFIQERMRIWEKKYRGEIPPYTDDPLLQNFRFCNILRELDRQTIEYHTLLNPLRDNFPLWLLNMFYARMVARPETIRKVGLLSFNPDTNEQVLGRLQTLPRPRYGTPYVFPVSTILRSTTPTRELFIARHLPNVMESIAHTIQSWQHKPVTDSIQEILPIFGFNLSFLWTEVLIDVAYQFPEHIDLFAEFPVGPGAVPTFLRLSPNKPSILAQKLGELHISSGLLYENQPIILSAENWEGIGCEFRKYTNLKSGKGRRRIYRS